VRGRVEDDWIPFSLNIERSEKVDSFQLDEINIFYLFFQQVSPDSPIPFEK